MVACRHLCMVYWTCIVADNIIVIRDPQTTVVIDAPSSSGVAITPGTTVVVDDNGLEVVVSNTGQQGPPGVNGAPGPPGVPGGTYFEQDFVNQSDWIVIHNLHKVPNVVIDIAGEEVETDVTVNSIDSVTLTFPHPYSGKVVCS